MYIETIGGIKLIHNCGLPLDVQKMDLVSTFELNIYF